MNKHQLRYSLGSHLVSFQVGEMLGEQLGSMIGWGDRTFGMVPKTQMPVDSESL